MKEWCSLQRMGSAPYPLVTFLLFYCSAFWFNAPLYFGLRCEWKKNLRKTKTMYQVKSGIRIIESWICAERHWFNKGAIDFVIWYMCMFLSNRNLKRSRHSKFCYCFRVKLSNPTYIVNFRLIYAFNIFV